MPKVPTFGIEEEYFLTDLTSRRMIIQPSTEAIRACKKVLGDCFADEMFQGQIEVASPVFSDLSQAGDYLASARTQLVETLQRYDIGVLCAGTHPLSNWREQIATLSPHVEQLFGQFRMVAQRSVLSGLHVHVAVPSDVDRIVVMNSVLPWLPLLLVLSVSSPLWEGQLSGYMSYRQTACDEWPRMGIPELFDNTQAYDAYRNLLMRTGSIKTRGDCWWNIRPSERYPTLELRITDACPCLGDALCIAGLFRAMVHQAVASVVCGAGARSSQTANRIATENRWRAKRFGSEGQFIVDEGEKQVSVSQWLDRAELEFSESADSLGSGTVFQQARHILERGTSAQRQIQHYMAARAKGQPVAASLEQLVDELLKETAAV